MKKKKNFREDRKAKKRREGNRKCTFCRAIEIFAHDLRVSQHWKKTEITFLKIMTSWKAQKKKKKYLEFLQKMGKNHRRTK